MKKSLITPLAQIFLILFLSININILAQESTFRSFDEFIASQNLKGASRVVLTENQIKGSAYLNKNFVLGSITTRSKILYQNIPLRYNIYNDDIEFKTKQGGYVAIANPSAIKEIKIGEDTFIYTTKVKNKRESLGFYKLTADGNTQLLTRYNIYFTGATQTTGYKAAEPPKFNKNPNTYFIKIGDNAPVRISKKKDLQIIFSTKSKELLAYVKKEKINIRKEDGLIKLVQFINQIN